VLHCLAQSTLRGDRRASNGSPARAAGARSGRRKLELRSCEIWSPLRDVDHVVDISNVLHDKLRAIRGHEKPVRRDAVRRGIQGPCRLRGEMHSWPGGAYAEAFSVSTAG
jgi:hypothetical protein